jgi:hypothetical protein
LWLGFRAGSRNWQAVAGGLLSAVGAACKFYPMILLAPLLIFRKYRIILGMLVRVALIVALDVHGWRMFLTKTLPDRVAGKEWSAIFDENASLEAFFLVIGHALRNAGVSFSGLVAKVLARVVVALALAIALLSTFSLRHNRDRRVQLAWICSFLPICIGTPSATYAYMLTNLIPLGLCGRFLMAQYRATKHARVALLVVFVGIGLGQFQAVALAKLVGHRGRTYEFLAAFCSVGLFVTVLSLAVFQPLVAWPAIRCWARRMRPGRSAARAE